MEIFTTSGFRRKFKKLDSEIKTAAIEKERIFRENPFNRRLKTHKLHGKHQRYWAFSVTNIYRIMFDFIIGENTVTFIDIDTHDIYR